MPFGLPITIKDAVEHIHKKEYLLPAIQREFVWSAEQIEKLFDSLMRGYPISSFLFWKVEKGNQKNYQFYEFIRDYHERDNKNNPKASVNGEDAITAILDGQQRLTSLYIGLKGSYAYKLSKKRWDNPSAFPKRRLCLNLLSSSVEQDFEFDFQFKADEEINVKDETKLWFVVGDIMNFKSLEDAMNYLMENVVGKYPADTMKFANATLCKLYQVIHQTQSINFFLEEGESLDKVLDIFVRINSGGTPLSYSDLLLSIASAEWQDRDAREEITSFVKELNGIGGGFNLNKDFVLKNCLVLTDKEIAFKVENFSEATLRDIEVAWLDITKAIKAAVVLVASLGYQRDTLTSSNAIVPIAYYLKKIGSPENFHIARAFEEDRKKISKWLRMALLKRTFSGQPDNVLRPMRDVIRDCDNNFPIESLFEKFKGTSKALSFDDDELVNLTSYEYGEAYTYSALAFLYPSLDFRNRFHLDHIYPKWMFTRKELQKQGVSKEDISAYLEKFNSLANLQLLEGVPNQEKSGKKIDEWMQETYPNEVDRAAYRKKNYIPDMELTIANFLQFIELRKALLVSEFQHLLR
jgi:uncharacterized protein with ParB-like and HNH nuclease domain